MALKLSKKLVYKSYFIYGAVRLATATFVQARNSSGENFIEGRSEITTGMMFSHLDDRFCTQNQAVQPKKIDFGLFRWSFLVLK